MHVFYEIILTRTLPTNPITEGADAGLSLALALKEKTARVTFIIGGILSSLRYMSRKRYQSQITPFAMLRVQVVEAPFSYLYRFFELIRNTGKNRRVYHQAYSQQRKYAYSMKP